MVLADFTFIDALWSMLVFFLWVAWFMMLFHIVGDIFRRHDIGGGKKTVWLLFVLFLPFLGTFVYVVANGDGINRRNVEQVQAAHDNYARSVSGGGASAEIERAKGLLDSGAITQPEYEALKTKALAAT